MTKANWKEAPEGAETYERFENTGVEAFCRHGEWWCKQDGEWCPKANYGWTTLEHRPRIIEWEDMKEGMVVRCVDVKEGGDWYGFGKECRVGTDGDGYFGPLEEDGIFSAAPNLYTFELVSEPEQDPQNWDVLIESPEGEGEGWTHVYGGDKCYIKVIEPDIYGHIVIVTQTDGYVSVCLDDVETIKPTITKEQFELLEKARQYFNIEPKDFAKFMNDYEVK